MLGLTFLFSIILLFITTKSATSFTCLPQITFLRRTAFQSTTNEPCDHPTSQLTRGRQLQQQVVPHSNVNSICQQHSRNLPTKLYSNIRWGVHQTKFVRYTSSSSSSSSLLFSTSSSMDSNTSSDSRLVTAVADSNEDQIEAIQMIFTNYCDADGLMTKMDVMKVPYIADLLVRSVLLVFDIPSHLFQFLFQCKCSINILSLPLFAYT